MIELEKLYTPLDGAVKTTVEDLAHKLRFVDWSTRTALLEAAWYDCVNHHAQNAAFVPPDCVPANVFRGLMTLALERLKLHSICGPDCAGWLLLSHYCLHESEFASWVFAHPLLETIRAAIAEENQKELEPQIMRLN